MRHIALLFALAATPAFAQTTGLADGADQSRFPVIGSSPELCQLGEPRISGGQPAVNVKTIIGRVLEIQELTDPKTLSTEGASVELAFDAFCNYPHRVTLSSENNGLFRQVAGGTPPLGFANAVPYRAELRWDDDSLLLDADALNRREARQDLSTSDPTSGPLLLRLRIIAGATNITTQAPLLAGEYRDTITITVGPQ